MELGTTRHIVPDEQKDFRRLLDRNHATMREPGPDGTVSGAPAPHDIFKSTPVPRTAKLSFQPQDQGITPNETVEVDATNLQDGLQGPRVRIAEPRDFPTPHADKDGNYLFRPEDPRFDATEAYVATNRALSMAEGYLGRELPWGFSEELGRNQLLVHPHAGANVANAFYNSDSGSLNFFSFTDPKTNEILRTGASGDVVAHETGHALLDALRHSYISSLSIAGSGFHESFGDMTAMLTAMQDDSVLAKLQQETKGDLTRPNLVSRNAEGLGVAVNHMSGKGLPDTLRLAINNYKYADQHFLPYYDKNNPNSGMGQEGHAYSNLFTGAFYDVFRGIYDDNAREAGKTFKDSVIAARDAAGKLLYRGVEFGPVGDPSYREVALGMIKADAVDNGGKYRPLLEKVFGERKILTPDDLKAFDEREKALPGVTLAADAVKKSEDAEKFLEDHRKDLGIGADVPLEFLESHTDNKGETFMQFGYHQDFALDAPEFGTQEGSKARANGGLLLAFDKDGKLIEDNFNEVTPTKVDDIKDHLKVLIGAGALSFQGAVPNGNLLNEDGVGYVQVEQTSGPNGPILQRAPVIWG